MRSVHSIVCVKPVPDPEHWEELRLDPDSGTLSRQGIPIVLDPLGKHALEQALRVREARGGQVTAISMAPPQTQEVLNEALAMGADSAVLLSDPIFAGADTLATAYTLSLGIKKLGDYDLILCGSRSLDGSTGQVGPQLAELLDIPHLSRATHMELGTDGLLRVRAKIENGYQVIETNLPALVTVEKEINTPRLKSLMGIVAARGKKAQVWDSEALRADRERVGICGSPTWVSEVSLVAIERRGEMITDPSEEGVKTLVETLCALGALPSAAHEEPCEPETS